MQGVDDVYTCGKTIWKHCTVSNVSKHVRVSIEIEVLLSNPSLSSFVDANAHTFLI